MIQEDKLESLRRLIKSKGRILIAYSGGVDSSLLAKIACDAIGDDALALIIDSELLPRSELSYAADLARSLSVKFEAVKIPILNYEQFTANGPQRCYVCKRRLFIALKEIAEERGFDCIADGLNTSDLKDYRPGIAASNEIGVWHPFVLAGISKEDIRQIARSMGLSFCDKPSSACLASRIPYGEAITAERLLMVERAEDRLRGYGFSQIRVRAHGGIARIEITESEMQRALSLREEINCSLQDVGFDFVTLDLEGYRSGSMDHVIEKGKPPAK